MTETNKTSKLSELKHFLLRADEEKEENYAVHTAIPEMLKHHTKEECIKFLHDTYIVFHDLYVYDIYGDETLNADYYSDKLRTNYEKVQSWIERA